MGWAMCCVVDCKNKIRTGLRRPSHRRGAGGQQLADGRMCWRCRARLPREKQPTTTPPSTP